MDARKQQVQDSIKKLSEGSTADPISLAPNLMAIRQAKAKKEKTMVRPDPPSHPTLLSSRFENIVLLRCNICSHSVALPIVCLVL